MSGGWQRLLLPVAPLYAAAVRSRAAAYRRGWLRRHRLPVPVVSVGNLSFGGTGKTPTVIALVRDLARRGRRPAVLSRGYGRAGREPMVVVGPDPAVDASGCGDEPLEMAKRLPGVPVVVDADRLRGGSEAIRCGADTLVLDDGFQHLKLERDLDLVVLDAGDPWAGGRLPPLGRLREPLTALRRATAVLVTKLPAEHETLLEEITARLQRIAGELPVLAARLEPSRLRTAEGWQEPAALAGRRIFAFAGIGRPQGFVDLLEGAGAELVGRRWFPDHHRYTSAQLDALRAAALEREAVAVTTAKDAVKLPEDSSVWVVEAEMSPLEGSWNSLWALLPEAIW